MLLVRTSEYSAICANFGDGSGICTSRPRKSPVGPNLAKYGQFFFTLRPIKSKIKEGKSLNLKWQAVTKLKTIINEK
jgi:hypothetical protein